MTYNGWRNYETWAVKLWMDNEEGSQRYWAVRTSDAWDEAEADGTFTRKERAVLDLADDLKAEHEETLPDLDGFAADLLNAAFGEVDWHEIAENLLDDLEPEEEEEGEDDECDSS